MNGVNGVNGVGLNGDGRADGLSGRRFWPLFAAEHLKLRSHYGSVPESLREEGLGCLGPVSGGNLDC